MPNQYTKRASPASQNSHAKRQRISSPPALTHSEPNPGSTYQSSQEDSLSSLSPALSRPSDDEDDDDEVPLNDVVNGGGRSISQKTRPGNAKTPATGSVPGKGPRKKAPATSTKTRGPVPPSSASALPSAIKNHPVVSSRGVPAHQPVPVATPTRSPILGATQLVDSDAGAVPLGMGTGRIGLGMVGGKGKKGEDALEMAVAAREATERRRVEYRVTSVPNPPNSSATGNVASGSGSTGGTAISLRLKISDPRDKREQKQKEREMKIKEEGNDDVMIVEQTAEAAAEEAEEVVERTKKERPALAEERENIIRFTTVTNDGSPSSLIILTGLKNIFQKQLPKMPKEYIARLVYDRNHYSMAIVKRGLEVVGGITYRPFEARKFAEIVFCAITGTEQVKGYGSHLMNHLKDHVKATTQCMHFLTYADNYAIGYFKKQGFSKEVGIDRSVWAGYIKDYEGGTIMHCEMLERIKYLDVAKILAEQKEVILTEIRQISQSHVVHPGLSFFTKDIVVGDGKKINPADVPGLRESGWTPEMDELTRRPKRGPQFAIMQRLLTVMGDHPSAWAFDHPVNAAEVTDYYDVIKQPMDLATMSRKLEANTYNNLDEFLVDARLIFSNCRSYNDIGSNYVKFANKLEQYMNDQLKIYLQ